MLLERIGISVAPVFFPSQSLVIPIFTNKSVGLPAASFALFLANYYLVTGVVDG
jgi:hypothetical protein